MTTATPALPRTFGAALRQLRAERAISLKGVQAQTGLTPSATSLLERELRAPLHESVWKAATLFPDEGDALCLLAGILPRWLMERIERGEVSAERVAARLAQFR